MSFQLFSEVIQAIETQFPEISSCVEPPILTERDGFPAFRYEDQSVEQALIQKAARIASGLNAAFVLLLAGHLQELRAIYRMLDEFSDEIVFLGDAIVTGHVTRSMSNS